MSGLPDIGHFKIPKSAKADLGGARLEGRASWFETRAAPARHHEDEGR